MSRAMSGSASDGECELKSLVSVDRTLTLREKTAGI